MTDFTKRGERTQYVGGVISLAIGEFEGPDGSTFERDIVHHPGAVSAVPVHDDDTVTLVRQYRAALDRDLLEIPAGKRDVANEAPVLTAHRELMEEVGLEAAKMHLLAEFYNSPGFCDERSFVYLATELTEVPHDRQGHEEQALTVERIPLEHAAQLIDDFTIVDAKTVIGISLAIRFLNR